MGATILAHLFFFSSFFFFDVLFLLRKPQCPALGVRNFGVKIQMRLPLEFQARLMYIDVYVYTYVHAHRHIYIRIESSSIVTQYVLQSQETPGEIELCTTRLIWRTLYKVYR